MILCGRYPQDMGYELMGSRKMVLRQTEFSALDQAYRVERDGRRRSHMQVIWFLLQDNGVSEASRVTGFSERWINILIDRWNAAGLAGLGDRRRNNKGAQPLLDDKGLAALDAALSEDPADGGVWSGRQVTDWMSDSGRAHSLLSACLHARAPTGRAPLDADRRTDRQQGLRQS